MLALRVLAFVAFCAVPANVSAQAWADAYRAGNYEKAADLLHQIVIESTTDIVSAIPEPYRQLAQMYSVGRGVPRDATAACSLARMAGQATMMAAPKRYSTDIKAYDAAHKESDEFIRTHCDALTADDRLTADRAMGCFAFGIPEQAISVAGRSVRVGRQGVSFVDGDDKPWELYHCPQLIAGVRTTSLTPPDDAAPGVSARQFLEVFFWTVGTKNGPWDYALTWRVYQITAKQIHFFATGEPIMTRSSWPGRGLPVEVEKGLTLEMIRSGHVRWKLDGAPPKRGWFMIGEGVKR